MSTTRTPLFDIGPTFPHDLLIGDVKLPIYIKNLVRAELQEFKKGFDTLFETPRGSDGDPSEEAIAARARARAAFCDEWIRSCLTLDPGVLRFKERDITDGAGFIDVFHARQDVIGNVIYAIFTENHLAGVIRKNSTSPRDSGPGLEPSMPARGGDRPAPIAASAESSTSASHVPAVEDPASSEDSPSSSGATHENEEPIVH